MKKSPLITKNTKFPIRLCTVDEYKRIPSEYIKDGWIESKLILPIPYELIKLKEDWTKPSYPGWWNGSEWDGYRIKKEINYKLWRRDESH